MARNRRERFLLTRDFRVNAQLSCATPPYFAPAASDAVMILPTRDCVGKIMSKIYDLYVALDRRITEWMHATASCCSRQLGIVFFWVRRLEVFSGWVRRRLGIAHDLSAQIRMVPAKISIPLLAFGMRHRVGLITNLFMRLTLLLLLLR